MKNIKLFEEFDDMNVELPEVSEKAELIGSFLADDRQKFIIATEGIINQWSIKEDRFWKMYMENGSVLNLFKQGDKHILALYKLDPEFNYKLGKGFDNNDSPVKFENGCWVKGSWN